LRPYISANRAQTSGSGITNDNVHPGKYCGLCLELASAMSGYRLRDAFSVQPLTAGFGPVNALCCCITARTRPCLYAEKGAPNTSTTSMLIASAQGSSEVAEESVSVMHTLMTW
jgi:hypothetical protein